MHGIRLSLNLRTQQAHADVNGSSGSKFCKLFGLWLLKARRVGDNDDWKTYYARWEWIGWMLKLMFLSRTGYVFNVLAWSCQLTFLFYLNNSETNPLIIACPSISLISSATIFAIKVFSYHGFITFTSSTFYHSPLWRLIRRYSYLNTPSQRSNSPSRLFLLLVMA